MHYLITRWRNSLLLISAKIGAVVVRNFILTKLWINQDGVKTGNFSHLFSEDDLLELKMVIRF